MIQISDTEKCILIKNVQDHTDDISLIQLIELYQNLVFKIAHKYKNISKIELDDLIQEGFLALIEAILTYSPTGCLNSYIYKSIRNSIINLGYKEMPIKYSYSEFPIDELSSAIINSESLKPFLFKHINLNLNSTEILIIKWKFGMDNEEWLTTKEISQITSLSIRRINRIIESALHKLKLSIERESSTKQDFFNYI